MQETSSAHCLLCPARCRGQGTVTKSTDLEDLCLMGSMDKTQATVVHNNSKRVMMGFMVLTSLKNK